MGGGGGGGCRYHNFPYEAEIPILVNGHRENRTFNSKEDVWKVVDMLISEGRESNLKGNDFDVAKAVNVQLPFFSCRNIFYDKEITKDINRYIYSKEMNVPPYKGSFGEQPALWIDKFIIIKSAFAKQEKSQIEAQKRKK